MPTTIQQYPLHTETQRQGAPEFCPVTGFQYWGHITHPELGNVPTYGGPFDTYTIPTWDKEDQQWSAYRYDHDAGAWVEGTEVIPAVPPAES